jgi:hypothetical protein
MSAIDGDGGVRRMAVALVALTALIGLASCRKRARADSIDDTAQLGAPVAVVDAGPAPPPWAGQPPPPPLPGATDSDPADDSDASAASTNADYHSTLVATFQKQPFRAVMAFWQGTHISIYDRRVPCSEPNLGRRIQLGATPWPEGKTITFTKVMAAPRPTDRVDLSNDTLTVNGKPAYWANYGVLRDVTGPTRSGSEWAFWEELTGTATYGKRPTREKPSTIAISATTASGGSISGKIDVHVCR